MIYENDELYHYGVKGMRWGHRKSVSELRGRYDSAKSNKRAANKAYNKAYNKSYNYSARHPISQNYGKHRLKSDMNWYDTIDKAKAYNSANKDFKSVKKERNKALKSEYKNVKKNSSVGEKIIYNKATRKKAAKYIVDNDMSMKDAKKKANNEAKRNTALILAGIGAVTLASYATRTEIRSLPAPGLPTPGLPMPGLPAPRR